MTKRQQAKDRVDMNAYQSAQDALIRSLKYMNEALAYRFTGGHAETLLELLTQAAATVQAAEAHIRQIIKDRQ